MSSKRNDDRVTFIDQVLAGNVDIEDVDNFIDEWHHSDSAASLHDYLGMTWDEYSGFVERPKALPFILRARRFGGSWKRHMMDSLADDSEEPILMAARGNARANREKLLEWLRKRGV